jgi:ATP-binding cassette subfamily C protein CydCD
VLDEPTAHLDAQTATELTQDFLAATRGCTTLLITHRLEDLDDVDEVIDLSAGRIVNRGRPIDVPRTGLLPDEVAAGR